VHECIFCNAEIRIQVECSGCKHWQHRTCDTGITRSTYREACCLGAIHCQCQHQVPPVEPVPPVAKPCSLFDSDLGDSLLLFIKNHIYFSKLQNVCVQYVSACIYIYMEGRCAGEFGFAVRSHRSFYGHQVRW